MKIKLCLVGNVGVKLICYCVFAVGYDKKVNLLNLEDITKNYRPGLEKKIQPN